MNIPSFPSSHTIKDTLGLSNLKYRDAEHFARNVYELTATVSDMLVFTFSKTFRRHATLMDGVKTVDFCSLCSRQAPGYVSRIQSILF